VSRLGLSPKRRLAASLLRLARAVEPERTDGVDLGPTEARLSLFFFLKERSCGRVAVKLA
jgi:hypothetical protein